MIRLSGCRVRDEDHPDDDIAIRFTGPRPGEKLYEELLIGTTDLPRLIRSSTWPERPICPPITWPN